jgi:DNA-binding CsgD family transcriptional regulator
MRKPNLPKYDEILTLSYLEEHYIEKQLNPYEIAQLLQCDHKTVRSYLKKHNIKLRNASEYNSLSHKTYTEPTDELLYSPLSIAMHSMYQCEGTTYEGVQSLCFCNKDENLIRIFIKGLKEIYKYESEITIFIYYKPACLKTKTLVNHYKFFFEDIHHISFVIEDRVTPIIKVNAGGKRLCELFLENIKKINELMET